MELMEGGISIGEKVQLLNAFGRKEHTLRDLQFCISSVCSMQKGCGLSSSLMSHILFGLLFVYICSWGDRKYFAFASTVWCISK